MMALSQVYAETREGGWQLFPYLECIQKSDF